MIDTTVAIIGCVIAVLGFIGALIKAISKLTATLQVTTVSLERLQTEFDQKYAHNTESHKRIWDAIGEQGDVIGDHEARIRVIEDGRK